MKARKRRSTRVVAIMMLFVASGYICIKYSSLGSTGRDDDRRINVIEAWKTVQAADDM